MFRFMKAAIVSSAVAAGFLFTGLPSAQAQWGVSFYTGAPGGYYGGGYAPQYYGGGYAPQVYGGYGAYYAPNVYRSYYGSPGMYGGYYGGHHHHHRCW